MQPAFAPIDTRKACVLVTPSPSTATWLSSVHKAVVEAGLQGHVLVTSDVDEAIRFGPYHWAILLPTFDAASEDIATNGNRARDISRALARAADAGGQVEVIDTHALGQADSIDLLPGLTLFRLDFAPDRQPKPGIPAALALYRHGHPMRGDRADWPLDFLHFSDGMQRNEHGFPEFDISGYVRIFAWGPHIFLSQGAWRVRIMIEVDAAAAKEHLAFDWGSLSAHTRLTARPGIAGVHEAVLDHVWETAEVAELRISIDRAAFSGRLTLLSMSVERLEPHGLG